MPPWGRRRKALKASATQINRINAEATRRLRLPRQLRALEYYDSIGEIWYASQFYSRALARLDLYVGRRLPGDDPNQEPEKVDDSAITGILDRIQDPGGGRMNLLGTFGRLRFLTGESYLICTAARLDPVTGDEVEAERWEMLSIDELRVIPGGGYQRLRAPGLPLEELRDPPEDAWEDMPPGTAVVYRLYRPHPRFSQLADAPMFAVLEIAEELLLLSLAVRARAMSRAAGPGILYVPEEISFGPQTVEADEDPELDPFLDDLTSALTTPLRDPGDASSVVPMIVRGPAEYGKDLIQLNFRTEGAYPETDLRNELIARLANGLDMPREALLGLSDLNHWNAWQVDKETWKGHLEPIAMELCQDLTAAYLRPAMRELGFQNAEEVVVWYDASRIIAPADKSQNSQALHAAAVLSDEALRRENGFDETDKPTDEEVARRIGILVRDGGLAITGVPTLRPGAQPEPGVTPDPGQDPQPPETVPGKPGDTPPVAGPPVAAPNGGSPPEQAALILGAAEMAVDVARAKAGARLRTALKKGDCSECVSRIDGVPNRLVPAVLGTLRIVNPASLPAMPASELVAGCGELLIPQLQRCGLSTEEAWYLARRVEAHAAQTLFDSDPLRISPEILELVH